MVRILLISHVFPPAVDGGSRVIWKIGEHFQSLGYKICTLSSDAHSTDDFTRRYFPVTPNYNSSFTGYYLPTYTITHRLLKLLSKFLPILSVFSKGPLFQLRPFLKALSQIIKFSPDWIIAGPLPTTTIIYARIIRKITGAKLIINASYHANDPDFHNKILVSTLKSSDYIWTLTKHETRYFHHHFQIPSSKMFNLGNGINKNFLARQTPTQLPTTSVRLLYVGSFAAHKGLETLFTALNFLPENYHLTIAGKKTLYNLLIPDKVKVIENFADSDLSKIIDNCHIFVFPSKQESFGLAPLEAMARGKPVIAANIPALAELIRTSKAGLLFKPNNPRDLANKISRMVSSKNFFLACSQNSLHFARSRTWDRIGESLWQKLLSS